MTLSDEELLKYTQEYLLDDFKEYIHCLGLQYGKFCFVNGVAFAVVCIYILWR